MKTIRVDHSLSKSAKKDTSEFDIIERDPSKTQNQDIPIIYHSDISINDTPAFESRVRLTETEITITRHPTYTKLLPQSYFSADIGPKVTKISKMSLPTPSFQSNIVPVDAKLESKRSLKTANELIKKKHSKKPPIDDMDVNSESQIFDPVQPR